MAQVDDLLDRITDAQLRHELKGAVSDLKRQQTFGLVFEEHIPETTALPSLAVVPGHLALDRRDAKGLMWKVLAVENGNAEVEPLRNGGVAQRKWLSVSDLLVVKRFGEPIFPVLTSLEEVRRDDRRPTHSVINGENFHALQLLLYLHKGQVDCIYIDPPYNTGARDWRYNNHYVDSNDEWRHSKWLSMMEKRLSLAKRLLAPDGVLICTIDKNEHAHLVMLLEQLFRNWEITSVTIVHNPRGVQGDNFSYTHEYAVFVIPPGVKSLSRRPLDEDERRAATSNLRNWGGASPSAPTQLTAFTPYMCEMAKWWDSVMLRPMTTTPPRQLWTVVMIQSQSGRLIKKGSSGSGAMRARVSTPSSINLS